MANTYTLISSYTVGAGGVSSVTFSSIPATYTDLLVRVSTRSNAGSVKSNLRVQFNSSATDFSALMVGVQNGSPFSQAEGATFANTLNYTINATSTTSNTFNNHDTYIANYAATSNKSFSTDTVMENNDGAVNQMAFFAGRWASSSALNSIYFYITTADFVQYSTFYIYGISNA
jgi:hypothetical protein